MGKMFALVGDGEPLAVNLKCDPDEAVFLRQMYSAIEPGYHMNKRLWNTVTIDGSIPDEEIRQMVDTSYNLVVKGLKKADREALTEL
jgi:predicted DNA-binding protein (MmcQ/YjbR family)